MKPQTRNLSMAAMACILLFSGCKNTQEWRKEADTRATDLLTAAQNDQNGRSEDLAIESAEDTLRRRLLLDQNLPTAAKQSLGIRDIQDTDHWKKKDHLKDNLPYTQEFDTTKRIHLTLIEAIHVAAQNNRDFQDQKETLFKTALTLDLEAKAFRNTFMGMLTGQISSQKPDSDRISGAVGSGELGVTRKFKNGVEVSSAISLDLAKMLTSGHGSSYGLLYDASISIPLLRGSGEFVVAENLTQAQRNLIYQVRTFEQYKRDFVVTIATSYLGVLKSEQSLKNQEENYKRVITSTRRSRRMADAGLLPEYQFDQTIQTELSARASWISAQQQLQTSLEAFRVLLGLPPDAQIYAHKDELDILVRKCSELCKNMSGADYTGAIPPAEADVILSAPDNVHVGPNEINSATALKIAFANRPDLQTLKDGIEDAQRKVAIAEDSLRAELTIGGSASFGESRGVYSGDADNARFSTGRGAYNSLLHLDLPIERTKERNAYRNSLINLEQSVRKYQALEDTIKQHVFSALRDMLEHRENIVIQRQAVLLAERRVDSTNLLLQAGRAEQRDVLDAQNALITAQNSLYNAVVAYRIDELKFQRTLGVLDVGVTGIWKELDLTQFKN